MSQKRQLVRCLESEFPSGQRVPPHRHPWHQLVYATEGVMTVEVETGAWVVPSRLAVWIPSGVEHAVTMTGSVRMQTLYVCPDTAGRMPFVCGVIAVTPLLRELIREAVRIGTLADDSSRHVRLVAVMLDQIRQMRIAPLQIKLPADPRARGVAERARADLSADRSIAELARGSGASVRTIERLFVRETGMTFGRWLQRVKALHALEALAAGASVTAAGLAVGYDSTSAFIAMFKRVLGTTPGSYFARARSAPAR